MNLLFKREQTLGRWNRVVFKLRAKLDVEEDEIEIIRRYRFDETILIAAIQPTLIRNTIIAMVIAFFLIAPIVMAIATALFGDVAALALGIATPFAVGYWYFNEKRETIFVKDLLHGRHFTCRSVVELAQKEAHLEGISAILRQVMESAKHWDGETSTALEPLPKEEALALIKSL